MHRLKKLGGAGCSPHHPSIFRTIKTKEMEATNLSENQLNETGGSRLLHLLQFNSIKIKGRFYVEYSAYARSIGLSGHVNGLIKRKQRYPSQFIEIEGRPYVSEQYAEAAINYNIAVRKMEALKNFS